MTNRYKVRIILFWWTIQDSNLRMPAAARLRPHIFRFAQRTLRVQGHRFEPPDIKKTYRSVRSGMFLVDDTGLEPVTLRTSSGCSYQLS